MSDTSKAVKSLERTVIIIFLLVLVYVGVKANMNSTEKNEQRGEAKAQCFIARIDAGLSTEDC